MRLTPVAPAACPEAVAAVGRADWVVLGPGSWFTSVIPHLLVPDLAGAIAASRARRLVTLNLAAERETAGFSLPDHLEALAALPARPASRRRSGRPGKRSAIPSVRSLRQNRCGRAVVLAPVAVADGGARHDPAALASALYDVLTAAESRIGRVLNGLTPGHVRRDGP